MTTQNPLKSIGQIKNEHQQKVDDLLKDCCVFFAFSNEQFEEGKKANPIPEGEKYMRIFGGGIMPARNKEKFYNGIASIHTWYNEALKENNARRSNIAYELTNHEAYYTGTIDETLEALGEDYTAEEVWKVFNEEREKHI